ncbi:hypothetical protein CsatB_001066 [Cannabis sativa]
MHYYFNTFQDFFVFHKINWFQDVVCPAQSQLQSIGDNVKQVYSKLMEESDDNNDEVNPSPPHEASSSQSQLHLTGTCAQQDCSEDHKDEAQPSPQGKVTENHREISPQLPPSLPPPTAALALETKTPNDDSEISTPSLDWNSINKSEKNTKDRSDSSAYLQARNILFKEFEDIDRAESRLETHQSIVDNVELHESWVVVNDCELSSPISVESPKTLSYKRKIQYPTTKKTVLEKVKVNRKADVVVPSDYKSEIKLALENFEGPDSDQELHHNPNWEII